MQLQWFGGGIVRCLGEYLLAWRLENGYTQRQMADWLSVHRTSYTKYETGVIDPPLATLCRMADIVGCTTDALLGRE